MTDGDPTRYATLAARLLKERPSAKASQLSRDVGISAVAHAMTLQKRRRGARALGGVLAFTSAAALALFFTLPRHPTAAGAAVACRGTGCAPAAASPRTASPGGLDAGHSIVAPAGGPTSVVLATGTRIALDQRSVLECKEDATTQRFALLRGTAHLHVAKLHGGERFLVETPNAEVEVRGTVFSVTIEPETAACAARTSVSVDEGKVDVRAAGGSLSLLPGDHWSSACAPPSAGVAVGVSPQRHHAGATPAAPVPGAPSSPVGVAEVAPTPEARSVAPAPTRPSYLAEQNNLYAQAEAAGRAGRSGEALAAYARLLALFPSGPLAENAVIERARILARSDKQASLVEAERYLARYPAGFARGEMEALTRSP